MSLGNVQVEVNNLRTANFDFGHDAPTTLEFGRMQPIHFKLVQAGTKSRVSTIGKTYFAPLSNPTYGKVFLHEYTQFVSVSSLLKQFPYFLAQLSRLNHPDQLAQIPSVLPRISAKMLMYILCKHGYTQNYIRPQSEGHSNTDGTWTLRDENYTGAWNRPNGSKLTLDFNKIGSVSHEKYFNPSSYDFSFLARATNNDVKTLLKLTKMGSSLLDVFYCSGLKPVMDDQIEYCALHLFAVYKAYYDIMEAPMTQYVNWEETPLCKLLRWYDVHGTNYTYNIANSAQSWFEELHILWTAFVADLCRMYYTANMDYISAHMPVDFASENPLTDSSFLNQRSHDGRGVVQDYFATPTQTLNPLGYVPGSSTSQGGSLFSQLSDEWCKMAYYQINKRSQLGYALKKELKIRGYRDWVYDNDSTYINHHRSLLPITEFDNTADTLNPIGKDGAVLGERAGKMTQATACFASTHFARETGYLIHFVCVVPESRVCNGASEDALTTSVNDWYSILTDGFGYSATPFVCIGAEDSCEFVNETMRAHMAFGIAPRHFGKKLSQNIKLGSFALRSQRDSTSAYYLDKMLVEHEIVSRQRDYNAATGSFKDNTGDSMVNEIPNAGPEWRQFARYGFSNKYNRIFEYKGSEIDTPFITADYDYPIDNIISLFEVKHSATAKMLPTSKSWDTIECEDDPGKLMTVEK